MESLRKFCTLRPLPTIPVSLAKFMKIIKWLTEVKEFSFMMPQDKSEHLMMQRADAERSMGKPKNTTSRPWEGYMLALRAELNLTNLKHNGSSASTMLQWFSLNFCLYSPLKFKF